MTLKSLPNEIATQCFQYLHYSEIFYSFERLNSRLDHLIGNIHFHLNFQHAKKRFYDQFCRKLVGNPSLKRQFFSLKLSNEIDTCGQISAFFRDFSLDQFSGLQCLTLIHIKQDEYAKIQSHFPSLSNLRSIFLKYAQKIDLQTFYSLPKVNKVTLSIDEIHICRVWVQGILPITQLIVRLCTSLNDLTKLLKFASYLKSLEIHGFFDDSSPLTNTVTVGLKRFVLRAIGMSFDRLEFILIQMPNLEQLQFHCASIVAVVDGHRWEQLISSLLTHLTKFKFIFELSFRNSLGRSRTIAQLFDKSIPYLYDTYQLTVHTTKLSQDSFDHIIGRCTSTQFPVLFLQCKNIEIKQCLLFSQYNLRDIHSLKKIVNLSNLTHLDIESTSKSETLLILLKIFQESPQLSSFKIAADHLISLMHGSLTHYFRKQIKKLHVSRKNTTQQIMPEMIERLCRIFSY